MKVTLIGHASVLVELEGAVCLMDPVFFDPFEEGSVVSCPQRRVHVDRLPKVDLLIISHRHPDHFDLRSIARISRDADVIIPADPLIAYALKQLGFARIHPVKPMAPIIGETFELYPTRSETRTLQEFGMVFKDRSGIFWNQVDTPLSDQTIAAVRGRFVPIDLLFAMYASQNFEFFESRAAEFPWEMHRRNLETALRIGPKAVAPASAGFRFCGDRAWLNAFLFPISRERFLADLGRVGYSGVASAIDPGDVVIIQDGVVTPVRGASQLAQLMADDRELITFDPTAAIPELVDPNPDGCAPAALASAVAGFVSDELFAFAQTALNKGDKAAARYSAQSASYGLVAVLPGGDVQGHRIDFSHDGVQLRSGANAAGGADVVHRIAASALIDWIECHRSFFHVRAYSRRHQTGGDISAAGSDVETRPRLLPDLLIHYLVNVAPRTRYAAKEMVDREIAQLALEMQ